MTNRTMTRSLISFCLAVAILSTSSMVGLAAAPQGPTGELTATGQVSVNGQNVISGVTVLSDSTVTTAKGSSAVVSLGKLGRVEVLPDSTVRLSFTDTSINGTLESGRVRVSSAPGINAVINTKDGSAVSDTSQADVFMVDVECGNTIVSTEKGRAELRSGSGNTTVPAGRQESIGQPLPGTRCAVSYAPPRGGDVAAGDLSTGKIVAVLVGVGAVIAAIVLVVSQSGNDNVQPNPNTPNPSAIS